MRLIEGGHDTEYEHISVIGEGSYGIVTKERRLKDGMIVACKSMRYEKAFPGHRSSSQKQRVQHEMLKSIQRELNNLRYLEGCSHVVQWQNDIAIDTLNGTVRLFMDYYEGGDLASIIAEQSQTNELLSNDFVASVFDDIVTALEQCHRHGLIHRDIKPGNGALRSNGQSDVTVLLRRIRSERYPRAVLSDFGVAKAATTTLQALGSFSVRETLNRGTPGYRAPEIICSNPQYTEKSDVFGVGCIVYEMMELQNAFQDERPTSIPPFLNERYFNKWIPNAARRAMSLSFQKRLDSRQLRLLVPRKSIREPLLELPLSDSDSESQLSRSSSPGNELLEMLPRNQSSCNQLEITRDDEVRNSDVESVFQAASPQRRVSACRRSRRRRTNRRTRQYYRAPSSYSVRGEGSRSFGTSSDYDLREAWSTDRLPEDTYPNHLPLSQNHDSSNFWLFEDPRIDGILLGLNSLQTLINQSDGEGQFSEVSDYGDMDDYYVAGYYVFETSF